VNAREIAQLRSRGYVEKSLADVSWLERPIRGKRGAVERIYINPPPPRYAVASGSCRLVEMAPPKPTPRPMPPSPPTPPVTITAAARRTIEHLTNWSTTHDELEAGGQLLGYVHDDGRVEVVDARRAETKREEGLVALDLGKPTGRLDGTRVVGEWHTHPTGSRVPSVADLAAWDQRFQHFHPKTGAP